jgi:hypothetical protein
MSTKGGRSRQLPTRHQLIAALKAARHLRSDRVLCLPDGSPMTRDRVIKAVRGAQRVAGIRLLDGRQCGVARAETLEIFWTRERSPAKVNEREGFSGAGYGNRTRLAGLGSQSITTMLSPPARGDRSTTGGGV